MFEDSLVESTGRIKTKKGWATLLSLSFQLMLVAAMVIVPLIYTEALPNHPLSSLLLAPAPPRPLGAKVAAAPVTARRAATHDRDTQFRTPAAIPRWIDMTASEVPPAIGSRAGPGEGDAASGNPIGAPDGLLNGIMTDRIPPPLPPAVVRPERPLKIILSQGVLAGYAIQQMKPAYPIMARTAGVSGAVVLQATISATGMIENIRTVSGSPLLIGAAIDAVKTWRYRPYLLNGTPVEVETQITVNFLLGRD